MPDLVERSFKLDNFYDYKSGKRSTILKPNEKYIVKLPYKVQNFSLLLRKHNVKWRNKKEYYSLIDEITRHDIAYYVKEESFNFCTMNMIN